MKIHITGMSPRMVSERAREQVTFARSLEIALTGMGHKVYRDATDSRDADLVVAGLSSVLSPGATYALVGLEHIGRALVEDTPLLLFVDDPELAKIQSSARSVLRDPVRIASPYLMSKRVKQSWQQTKMQREQALDAVAVLAGEIWPTVLAPLHPWASPAIVGKRLQIASEVVPVDVTSTVELPSLTSASTSMPPPAQVWLTDRHYSPALLEPERVRWPVIPVNSADLAVPAGVFAVASGVHQGAIDRVPGWWTPTPLYVAHANTVYLCDSEENSAIGTETPYYLTPDQVESCDSSEHTLLAERQREYLKEVSWDSTTLSSRLADVIGRISSSGTADTSGPTSRTS